jgi:hypothetical protein
LAVSDPVITPERAALPVIDLPSAHYCQDCDGISTAPNGHCARCGSRSLLSLAAVLNRKAADLTALAAAIDRRAVEIYAGAGNDAADRADAKDLARALAGLLLGQPLGKAFGAPVHWGYGTPIGYALAEVYRQLATHSAERKGK